MNAIVLGGIRGRGQKTTSTQKVCLFGIFTCSHITFTMVCSFYFLCFGSRRNECNSFWGEKGEKSEVYYLLERYIIQKKKMIYCHNIVVNLSYTMIAGDIILSAWQHRGDSIRISHNLLSPSPSLSKDYCIHSFWSQNTEKRNTAISQMRLRSVSKMQISILNTATTEQMGYGSISFFVCFLLNELNSKIFHCYIFCNIV